jgi:hypothetical protein
MLLRITSESARCVLKHDGMDKVISYVSSHPVFRSSELASAVKIGKKCTHEILRSLLSTEHLEKQGRAYRSVSRIHNNYMTINLRDVRSDALFKWKGTRQILYELCVERSTLAKASEKAGISYRMAQWIARKLRGAGILLELEVNPCFLEQPQDPFELIPRRADRTVLRELADMVESRGLTEHALIFFGDASFGFPSPVLNLMVLMRGDMEEDKQEHLMQSYVAAASNVTLSYGRLVEVSFAIEEAWLAQKLGITSTVSSLLCDSYAGICLSGRLPLEEDYFELLRSVNPPPQSRIREWLDKGYLTQVNGKLAYTSKALQKFRQEAPTNLMEVVMPILEKKVRFIIVGKPGKA